MAGEDQPIDLNQPFVVDDSQPQSSGDADGAPHDLPGPADDELDGLRIRQLATARRAAYRARSYCVIAAACCFVTTVQLVWMTVQHVHATGWAMPPVGYVMIAGLALLGAGHFVRRALDLHREATRSALPPPPLTAPDFSSLDDESKRWRNLEDLR